MNRIFTRLVGGAMILGAVRNMGRSATNVIGNSVATVAMAKWEGQYQEEAA